MHTSSEQQVSTFNFPNIERKVFQKNYLDTVVIELRYPTYLRLNEKEPLDISDSIRKRFPLYEQNKEMQMTPLGTTEPQPYYQFTTRVKDPVISISASNLALTTKKYKSFEDFSSHIEFLITHAIPHVDTTFFTRVGLRYINNITGIQTGGVDVLDWINKVFISPLASGEIGTINNMESKLSGQLPIGGGYTFRYGLSPLSREERTYLLDWDYYKENVEVGDCMGLLKSFHDVHLPFFWWALGKKAREALQNGTAGI